MSSVLTQDYCGVGMARTTFREVKTTGERIREARASIKMSQAELARQLGISPGAMWKYEKDKVQMGPERLADTAKVLRVSMEWLLTGDEPDAPPDKGAKISPPAYHEFVEKFGEFFDEDVVKLLEGPAHNRMGPFGEPTAKEYYELARLWQQRKDR